MTHLSERHRRRGITRLATPLVVAAALAIALASSANAETPEVRHHAGPAARSIGLIGDSTLAGVRWYDRYGPLARFNFLLDAESCRRTIETSCWSREQYRATNAMDALRAHAGDWGDALVMMTGYNDPNRGFRDAVEAILDEAERQGIGAVVWLSLRTKGVDYEEPLHQANGSTYRDANRALYEVAAESGGSLHVADWASHSADRPDWFERDGVHLSPAGAAAASEFIAEQLDALFAGRPVTPHPMPWEEVRPGDTGRAVDLVQMELLRRGFDSVGFADGVYGDQTAWAVAELQRSLGLDETGIVDEDTAVAIGLAVRRAPEALTETLIEVETEIPAASGAAVPAVASPVVGGAVATAAPRAGNSSTTYALIVVTATGGAWWWHRMGRHPAPARTRRHAGRPDATGPPRSVRRDSPRRRSR
jgi:lysophospholipase L1-like esterase